ncbi:hypothetical protein ABPG72_009408 [Tetrahymena utriculariae]
MLFFIFFALTTFIICDDVQIALVTDGINPNGNVVLNNLSNSQCLLNPCNNQFCSGVFKLQSTSTSIHTNSLIFPHFQVVSIVDIGVTNAAITQEAIKNIIQLNNDSEPQYYTNFSMGDYASFTVNAGCILNSFQLTYFFQVLSIMNTGSDLMTTTINDYNTPVHSFIYRYQINVNTCHPTCLKCSGKTSNDCTSCQQVTNFFAGSNGSCSCTDSTNYFQNGQCVTSCSTNYVPSGKYCYYNYGCSTPDPSNNGKCQTCTGGYYNNDGICQTQNTVPPGYVQQGQNFVLNASLNPQQIQNIQYFLKAFNSYSFSDLEVTNKGFSINHGRSQQPLVTSCNGVNILGGFMSIKQNTAIQFPPINISTQYYQIFFTVYLIDFDNNLSSSYINIVLSDGNQLSSYAVSTSKLTSYYCGLNQQDTIDSFSFVQKIGASTGNIVTKNFQIINNSNISYGYAVTNIGYIGIRDITVIGFDCKDPNCTDCPSYVCISCADKYFLNSFNRCQSCISNCKKCPNNICSECLSGYYRDSNNQCQKCSDSFCDQCTGPNQSDCTLCLQSSLKPYLLVDDNSCSDCILDGHYKSQTSCLKCITNCKTCSDNSTCSKCSTGYYIDSNQLCQKCSDSFCDQCTGPNKSDCTLCQQGSLKPYLLVDNNTCSDCILDGHYKSFSSCLKCILNCKSCSDSSTCSKCLPGYYVDSNQICQKCSDSFCDQCIGPNKSDCTLCQQGSLKPYLLVDNNTCSDCILDGHYKNTTQCLTCIQNCITCFNSSTCSKCSPGYYIDSTQQCQKCYDPFCDQCSSANKSDCTLCQQSSLKLYLLIDDNSCSNCNLEGYFKNTILCSKCIQNCITCSDSSTCSKCSPGYFVNQSNQCEKCFDPNCLICSSNNKDDCTSCNSVKLYFLSDDHSCTDCKFDGYYIQSNNCLKCIPNCLTCLNGNTCDLCQSGYHVHEQTNQCVICSQQSGYYVSGRYCKQCNIACKECSGPTDQDCSICNEFYFQIDPTTNRCQTCPNNSYLISSKQNCQKCNYQCILCNNITLSYSMLAIDESQNSNQIYCLVCSCQQCKSSYILFNQKQCTQSCESIGSNYIYNYSTNTCNCQQGYNYLVRNPYKNNFDCSNGSGYGYYCDSNNICLQCSQNCNSCSDSQTCTKCNEGSYLWQNACYKNCFPDLNIVPNIQTGNCECPDGYNFEKLNTPKEGQNMICQLSLLLQQINIYNYLAQSNDIPIPTSFRDNLIIITYNRKLTSQEFSSFSFLIDKETLNLGNQYNITSISIENQNIKVIITSQQNRKVKQFTISIQGSTINYQIRSALLVSSDYGDQSNSFASSKQLTQNLQTLTQVFSPDQNSVAGKVITLLKQFQILCYISNFVQVLPMIYLIKEYLPPKVNFASLFGATLVFNQTPPPTQISFESQQIDSYHLQYLKDTLKSFGIKPGIYSNFLQPGDYLVLKAPNIYGDIDFRMKGSKSYILISFLKKYFIVILFLIQFQSQFQCAIISSVIYGVSGLYLFVTIKQMQATANEDVISNEALLKIELLGSIVLIFIITCLSISTLLQLIRYVFLIQDLIKTYQKNKKEKQQKQKEFEILISSDILSKIREKENQNYTRIYSLSISNKQI